MKLLLDTCTILWAVSKPKKLSRKAQDLITDHTSLIFVSPMSCAEIACLSERKIIELDNHWKLWFRKYIDLNGWDILPIDLPIIEEAYSLPDDFHKDPVDRILVACSRLYQAAIVTGDKKILKYPHVESIW
jgi:PIN domain nuclease of toxin-antitoxin system